MRIGGYNMRKFNILNENYMALEQSIARALERAGHLIRESKLATEKIVDEYFKDLRETGNSVLKETAYERTPEFINFRNNEKIAKYIDGSEIQKQAIESIKKLRGLSDLSLDDSASLSVFTNEIEKIVPEDEVEEISTFFGGKDNIDIPDSESNNFHIQISDIGARHGINQLGKIPGKVDLEIKNFQEAVKTNNLEKMSGSLQNLALLDSYSKFLKK